MNTSTDFMADFSAAMTRLESVANEVKDLQSRAQEMVEKKTITNSDDRDLLALNLPTNDPMYGWLTGKLYSRLTGYSEDAMRKKTKRDDFIEGVHYVKSEFDGKLWYNYPAIARLALHGA